MTTVNSTKECLRVNLEKILQTKIDAQVTASVLDFFPDIPHEEIRGTIGIFITTTTGDKREMTIKTGRDLRMSTWGTVSRSMAEKIVAVFKRSLEKGNERWWQFHLRGFGEIKIRTEWRHKNKVLSIPNELPTIPIGG